MIMFVTSSFLHTLFFVSLYTLNPKIQNNIAGPAIAQWLTRKNSETTMISVGIVEKAAFGQLIL